MRDLREMQDYLFKTEDEDVLVNASSLKEAKELFYNSYGYYPE